MVKKATGKERRRKDVGESKKTNNDNKKDESVKEINFTLLLPPEEWPKGINYIGCHCIPSIKLDLQHQLTFCIAPRITNENHPIQCYSKGYTEIRKITNLTKFKPAFGSELKHHPALGQFGLFAKRSIPPKTLVIPYFGLVHLTGKENQDEDQESQYDAAIQADDGTQLGIDATKMGTSSRFVNDYRGILQRPNLFFQEWSAAFPKETMSIYQGPRKEGVTQIDSIIKPPQHVRGLGLYSGAHPIDAGTELCVSYGKGWWAARQD